MLISVIIVGAVMTGIVISVIFWGTDQTQNALLDIRSSQARSLANTCSETALQLIRNDINYSGSGGLALSTGTCSYTVINGGSSNRTINASGTSNNVVRKNKIIIDQINPLINIVSWQEVADF